MRNGAASGACGVELKGLGPTDNQDTAGLLVSSVRNTAAISDGSCLHRLDFESIHKSRHTSVVLALPASNINRPYGFGRNGFFGRSGTAAARNESQHVVADFVCHVQSMSGRCRAVRRRCSIRPGTSWCLQLPSQVPLPGYFYSTLAANVCTVILPSQTTNVSVPSLTSAPLVTECHTMYATSPTTSGRSIVKSYDPGLNNPSKNPLYAARC
jgi:hypothetical protein